MSEAVNDARTFARNAKGVRELLYMKFDTLPFEGEWYDAFGTPESRGVWIVWGKSGSGKTSFVMKLCKELCKYGRVVYNSLEEGISLTMQNTVRRIIDGEIEMMLIIPCLHRDKQRLFGFTILHGIAGNEADEELAESKQLDVVTLLQVLLHDL